MRHSANRSKQRSEGRVREIDFGPLASIDLALSLAQTVEGDVMQRLMMMLPLLFMASWDRS